MKLAHVQLLVVFFLLHFEILVQFQNKHGFNSIIIIQNSMIVEATARIEMIIQYPLLH